METCQKGSTHSTCSLAVRYGVADSSLQAVCGRLFGKFVGPHVRMEGKITENPRNAWHLQHILLLREEFFL